MSVRLFRRSSLFAIAITGLLILLFASSQEGVTQEPDTLDGQSQATEEATGALRGLWTGLVDNLPKIAIAVGILLAAALLVVLIRRLLRRVLRRWERAEAIAAITGIVIWLIAAAVVLSVLAGDIRALAGSLGLVGLALSWALQTPIESFTGWLLNSFKDYYRVGDRISVGEVYGDVYRIEFLNTTIWEYGGQDQPPGWIQAEQPTGRLITFPNNEILHGAVVNYTRHFPFLWDELTFSVANESDLDYARGILQAAATAIIGDYMREPARKYRTVLQRQGLDAGIADHPEVYASITESGTDLTIRYLVGAREKRSWRSRMVVELNRVLNHPDHRGRILPVYPRHQVQLVHRDGSAADVPGASHPG